MIDASALPTDREGRRRWLLEREEQTATMVRTALVRIVATAVDRFVASLPGEALTAAGEGDLAAFDRIPDAWMTVVREELLDQFGETYQAGQVTAWLGLPYQPTEAMAKAWTAIANENAQSYLDNATNRLVNTGDSTWRLIRGQVQNSMRDGFTIPELRDKVEGLTGFAASRAEVIARTETIGAYVQGDMAGNRALGKNGPTEKVWRATLDRRTRPSHAEAEGQVRKMDDPFDIGGTAMDSPHDPTAPAGEVVQCRCYVEFLYPTDARPDGSPVEVDTLGSPAGEVAAPPEPDPIVPPEQLPSSLLDYANAKTEARYADTMAELDKLHRIEPGRLPTTTVKYGGKAQNKGGHFTPGSRGPRPARRKGMDRETYLRKMQEWRDAVPLPEIRVNDRGDGTELLSFLHEYGHRVDYLSHRFDVQFYSAGGSPASRAFIEAARASGPYTEAYANFKDFGYVQYFRSDHEVWARAYSQWAADEIGGTARAALDAARAAERGINARYQWTDAEFADIKPHVEAVLRERGLLE